MEVGALMKKKDIHVLDWSKIIEGTTAKQVRKGNKDDNRTVNKGILFEDMVEKLLAAMFPNEVWRRTAESHDGKRDFVYPAEVYLDEQKWAECKNYDSSLSLNVIAPTLIMGAIENIEYIFFFSYSHLNDNAIEGILRYSETKKASVKIFDGNLLESLICRYHATNGIAEFFPNTDFQKAYLALQKKRLRVVKTVRDLNGNIVPSTHLFELGERFYIRTVIQNLTWEPIDCVVSFQTNNDTLLLTDACEHGLLLPFAELEEYSVLCETLRAGSTNCIVKITDQGHVEKEIKKITQKIKIIDEPYLAWSGENAFSARRLGLAHLSGYENPPLFIVGESGTGKSTLMEILLREKCVRERYKIARIDLSLSRTNSVRNLFSQVIGVQGKEETPKEQLEEDGKALSLLVDSYAESASMIASTIIRFYDRVQPYLFVIDDIQKISRSYIALFQELDDLSSKNGKPIFFLFTLNEDSTTLDELLARLNWDENYQNRKCKVVRLTKFGKKDILTYLKTRYGLKDIDDCFEGFDKEICPLELRSFCMGLKNSRIITQVPNSQTYQIVDRFKFSEGIKHILYANISIKSICEKLDKGGISEYALKYLYITDKINTEIERKNPKIHRGLMDQGILRERNGATVFYHDKIREVIGRTLTFYEEDYADIFAARDTDDSSKAICALKQLGRIRGGSIFLKGFFISGCKIEKAIQRYNVCWLVFERLSKLSDIGLTSVALKFVRNNYAALNEEHGHATFFQFLKHIADSALACDWDTDEESIENMAYFIKKYFDRALSTYNYQDCLDYFKKFEKIFTALKHISNKRRAFWLSHYANRAAIALDRTSNPLATEPVAVSALYDCSQSYCTSAGFHRELRLQIIVDNFNRHYVYRHDLTAEIIQSTYKQLSQIKHEELSEPMVLKYHLLLLEYLRCKMVGCSESDMTALLVQVKEACKGCTSSFYTIKLFTLELYILIDLRLFSDAANLLSPVFEFAYKKEMRSYVYKLTYIKAHLMIFQDGFTISSSAYKQIALALEQMMSTRGNMANDLKREVFLVVRMAKIIATHEPDRLSSFACLQSNDSRELLQDLCAYTQGEPSKMKDLFGMESYYVFEGVSFPTI